MAKHRGRPIKLVMGMIGLGLGFLVWGCGGGDEGAGEGEPCTAQPDCGDNLVCVRDTEAATSAMICAAVCSTSAQCTGGRTCSVSYGQPSKLCLTPCTQHDLGRRFVCESGAFAYCNDVQTETCSICGCDVYSENPVCDTATNICGPKRELGGACGYDNDCVSGRCGGVTRMCELMSGSACVGLEQHCENCVVTATGSACKYSCNQTGSRGCDNNSRCFRDVDDSTYCALRCYSAGTECAWGGDCTWYLDYDDNEENNGPWCL
jgi:hypothetical protein